MEERVNKTSEVKEINGIPVEVFREYEVVRQTGICNMFNVSCVRKVAQDIGLENLVEYTENPKKYADILQNYDKAIEMKVLER